MIEKRGARGQEVCRKSERVRKGVGDDPYYGLMPYTPVWLNGALT